MRAVEARRHQLMVKTGTPSLSAACSEVNPSKWIKRTVCCCSGVSRLMFCSSWA